MSLFEATWVALLFSLVCFGITLVIYVVAWGFVALLDVILSRHHKKAAQQYRHRMEARHMLAEAMMGKAFSIPSMWPSAPPVWVLALTRFENGGMPAEECQSHLVAGGWSPFDAAQQVKPVECICHDESLTLVQRSCCKAPGERFIWLLDEPVFLHSKAVVRVPAPRPVPTMEDSYW